MTTPRGSYTWDYRERANLLTLSECLADGVFEAPTTGSMRKNPTTELSCQLTTICENLRFSFKNCFEYFSKEVTALSVNATGDTLISGAADQIVRFWHIRSGQCIKQLPFKGNLYLVLSYLSLILCSFVVPTKQLFLNKRNLIS